MKNNILTIDGVKIDYHSFQTITQVGGQLYSEPPFTIKQRDNTLWYIHLEFKRFPHPKETLLVSGYIDIGFETKQKAEKFYKSCIRRSHEIRHL